jgi:hypothetical protein
MSGSRSDATRKGEDTERNDRQDRAGVCLGQIPLEEIQMAKRARINDKVLASVLVRSRRRCCLCFFLDHEREVKDGQVAHIDGRRSNNAEDNLVYLCLHHHDKYDSRAKQTRRLTADEIKHHRQKLYEAMETSDGTSTGEKASSRSESQTEAIDVSGQRIEVRVRRPNLHVWLSGDAI